MNTKPCSGCSSLADLSSPIRGRSGVKIIHENVRHHLRVSSCFRRNKRLSCIIWFFYTLNLPGKGLQQLHPHLARCWVRARWELLPWSPGGSAASGTHGAQDHAGHISVVAGTRGGTGSSGSGDSEGGQSPLLVAAVICCHWSTGRGRGETCLPCDFRQPFCQAARKNSICKAKETSRVETFWQLLVWSHSDKLHTATPLQNCKREVKVHAQKGARSGSQQVYICAAVDVCCSR